MIGLGSIRGPRVRHIAWQDDGVVAYYGCQGKINPTDVFTKYLNWPAFRIAMSYLMGHFHFAVK